MSRSTPEGAVVKSCLEILKLHGIFAYRNNTGAFAGEYKGKRRFVRFGEPGMPDIVAIVNGGRWLGVECKRPGKRAILTDDQVEMRARIVNAGGLHVTVQSGEELERYLRDIGAIR